MTEIHLVRHAQSLAQTGEAPWLDPDLSELGTRQARALGTVLGNARYALTILSPLLRARRTFELARLRTEEIRFDSRLVEVTLNRGKGYDYREILPYATPGYGEPDAVDMWTAAAGVRVASLLSELRGVRGPVLMIAHCGLLHVVRHYLSGDPIDGEPILNDFVRQQLMNNVALSTAELGATPRGDRIVEWNRTIVDLDPVSSAFL